jgi:hypothetical protein
MSENVAQIYPAVRFRLSPAQIAVIALGIKLLTGSYQTRLRKGTSPFSYPFRIHPPPRGFDCGTYNKMFMEKLLDLGNGLLTKTKTRKSVQLDTFQLRAAVFAIRAYIDYLRLLRRRIRGREAKAEMHIDDKSFARRKAKSQRVIRSLERHMKRANRALTTAVGKEQYVALTGAWKAHLRWMRLRIIYCKPWARPHPGRRARQQRDLDELVVIAKRGLHDEGYKPPEDKELRRLMRLYARYARKGRIGMWVIGFLHEDKERFRRKYYLAHFVIGRSKLKELSKS